MTLPTCRGLQGRGAAWEAQPARHKPRGHPPDQGQEARCARRQRGAGQRAYLAQRQLRLAQSSEREVGLRQAAPHLHLSEPGSRYLLVQRPRLLQQRRPFRRRPVRERGAAGQ